MTLDQRAIVLATAVMIDFDYFSKPGSGFRIIPIWIPGTGGAVAEAGITEAAMYGAAGAGAAVAGHHAMQGSNGSTSGTSTMDGTSAGGGSDMEGGGDVDGWISSVTDRISDFLSDLFTDWF